jgi:NCS1 family nucleobase:cation symporter-1
MIADYFLVRRASLNVDDLYRRGGLYEYARGFNPRALWALAAGIFLALVGLVFPPLHVLYQYAWFVGFLASGAIYYGLMLRSGERIWQSSKQQPIVSVSSSTGNGS